MHAHHKLMYFAILLMALVLISGCGQAKPATVDPTEPATQAAVTQPPVTVTQAPTEAPTPTEEPTLAALPPEPQEVSFTNSLGAELHGYYYPAAVNPAPLVVLMHWPNGDMSDWYEVAVWLQNRGQANPFTNPVDEFWWDESWFPSVPADQSYGVLIFSFSNSKPGPINGTEIDTSSWLDDAQSAILKAVELEGVDPDRIITIGAVHGADGAADACLYLNQQGTGTCIGTLALSPGSYLMQDYPETVKQLGEISPDTKVECIGMEYEITICEYAASLGNSAFAYQKILGTNQGMTLFQKDLDPLPMQMLLDFLDDTLK